MKKAEVEQGAKGYLCLRVLLMSIISINGITAGGK